MSRHRSVLLLAPAMLAVVAVAVPAEARKPATRGSSSCVSVDLPSATGKGTCTKANRCRLPLY